MCSRCHRCVKLSHQGPGLTRWGEKKKWVVLPEPLVIESTNNNHGKLVIYWVSFGLHKLKIWTQHQSRAKVVLHMWLGCNNKRIQNYSPLIKCTLPPYWCGAITGMSLGVWDNKKTRENNTALVDSSYWVHKLNVDNSYLIPLSPSSDQCQISPNHINQFIIYRSWGLRKW